VKLRWVWVNVACHLLSDDYAPQRAGHASLPGPTAPLLTELLQLPVPGYGTVYRHISEMLPYRTVGHYRHFCLDSGATAQCELFWLRHLEIVLLTYLITKHTCTVVSEGECESVMYIICYGPQENALAAAAAAAAAKTTITLIVLVTGRTREHWIQHMTFAVENNATRLQSRLGRQRRMWQTETQTDRHRRPQYLVVYFSVWVSAFVVN